MKLFACETHCLFRLLYTIGVHFQLDTLLEWVGLLVACEADVRIGQQPLAHWIAQGVVLLTHKDC